MDGLQVTIRDESSRIIGLATTASGTCTLNNLRNDAGLLEWTTSGAFSVDLPRVAFYQFSVNGTPGEVRESYAQLAAAHFVVSLSTGSD